MTPHTPSSPTSVLVIVGTDTGVGKTTVSLGLLALARRAGVGLVPHKPVETGFSDPATSDAGRLLAAAAPLGLTLDEVCPYRFPEPIAPAAAAEAHGIQLTLARLCANAERLRRKGDGLLIEAAGGLLSPYAPGLTALDLATALGAPVLLIARNGLGTINHTTLAMGALERHRHPLAGVILVTTTPLSTPDQPTNALWIERLTGHRPIGTLPFLADTHPERLADALSPFTDVRALIKAEPRR